ncbi:Alpha/Beta hydrolase protein [Podospora australis]|uniref:Alpha/Beta hydrolase protein n=1 Tax=Podospora australis TaxID=1536484 RepID=A0AAN6WQA8_9PEZI|nr:Alpha/Beta hydrolase protein [Podospora australis]
MATNIPPDAHTREVFYVGTEYTSDASGSETICGQICVERLVPVAKPLTKYPIVLIPGSGRTSIDFLTTPSPNVPSPSWSSSLLASGHELYLMDPPFRGRSPWHPSHLSSGNSTHYQTFGAASLKAAWTSSPASTQWPSPIETGSPEFDHVMASTFPQLTDLALEQTVSQKGVAELLDKIGKPVILLAHSMGCKTAWLAADARPDLVKAIVAVEPAGPPFQGRGMGGLRKEITPFGITEARISFEPPGELGYKEEKAKKEGDYDVLLQDDSDGKTVRKLKNLEGTKVLVVTGGKSVHAKYDWGTAEFLRQAGVREVKHVLLGEAGIEGNGHMMMLEKNRGEIIEVVEGWVKGI